MSMGGSEPSEDGRLSRLTLQALLPQRPVDAANSQPGVVLAAEPSVLTAYITGLEEDSNLVQRQLTHLQASTSSAATGNLGGLSVGPTGERSAIGSGTAAGASAAAPQHSWAAISSIPPPLRSARNAPGRREVFVLSKWLEVGGAGRRESRWAGGQVGGRMGD